jgi:hypothetical protein
MVTLVPTHSRMIRAGRGVQLRGKFKPGRLNRENGILGPSCSGGVSIPSIKGGALLLSEDSEEESMVNWRAILM